MAFEVRCPNCNKLYAAEWRLVGKRIRCRACQHVFHVGAPADAPVPAAAAAAGAGPGAEDEADRAERESVEPKLSPDASHVGASDLAKTRQGVVVEKSKDGAMYEEAGAGIPSMLRPSVPQQFPMSDVVEAWLPLALGLISAVWVISQTFGSNQTGRAWVALMRVAIVAGLYLLLIVPVINLVVKSNFRKLRRVLPPSLYQRTALTFALPLTLGYVFWLVSEGGLTSFITGLLLGIVFMAAVYWLLFRLDPQEAAQSYVRASSAFLGGVAVSAMIVVGASMWVNKVMISTGSARDFKENPVASPLTWTVPPPSQPKPKIIHTPDHNEPAVVNSNAPSNSTESAKPPAAPANDAMATGPHGAGDRSTSSGSNQSTIDPPKVNSTDSPGTETTNQPSTSTETATKNPDSKLFDVGTPDGDSFLQKLRTQAWVKDATCPSEEGTYDTTLSPLTPSPYIGFLKTQTGQMELCQLAPNFAKMPHPILVPVPGGDVSKLIHHVALAPDGAAVLQMSDGNGPSALVRITAVNPTSGRVPSPITVFPNTGTNHGVLSPADAMLQPELLGALPDDRFLVRWTGPNRQIIQVWGYWQQRQPLLQFDLNAAASDQFAVDSTGSWYASVHSGGRLKSFQLNNLRNGRIASRTLELPSDKMNLARADCTGLAFNQNTVSRQVAALFEEGGKATIQCWFVEDGSLAKDATFPCPAIDPSPDHPQPASLAWVGDGWLVHGTTLVSNFTKQVVGSSPDSPVDGVQVLNSKTGSAYLSYIAPDGRARTAAVTVEPTALRAPKGSTGPGAIKVGE